MYVIFLECKSRLNLISFENDDASAKRLFLLYFPSVMTHEGIVLGAFDAESKSVTVKTGGGLTEVSIVYTR